MRLKWNINQLILGSTCWLFLWKKSIIKIRGPTEGERDSSQVIWWLLFSHNNITTLPHYDCGAAPVEYRVQKIIFLCLSRGYILTVYLPAINLGFTSQKTFASQLWKISYLTLASSLRQVNWAQSSWSKPFICTFHWAIFTQPWSVSEW